MTVYRTNPATGRVEVIEATTSEPRHNPLALRPLSAPRQTSIEVSDYSRPEAKLPPTIMAMSPTSRGYAERNFARLQDSAIERGLLSPTTGKWTDDAYRLNEVSLAKMQLETARQAVAYEATVAPHRAAQDDALREAAWEEQMSRSIDAVNDTMRGKPIEQRVVHIGEGAERRVLVVGGPAWPPGVGE